MPLYLLTNKSLLLTRENPFFPRHGCNLGKLDQGNLGFSQTLINLDFGFPSQIEPCSGKKKKKKIKTHLSWDNGPNSKQ